MGLFSSGPLSNQALGVMPGDQPDYSRMEMPGFPQASERRGGLLGFLGGGLGKSLLGGVLDGVAIHYGAQPGFSNARAQQQQMDLWNKKRQAEADDALRLAREKTQMTPRYFEANNGDQYAIGADGLPKKVFTDPTPKTSWTVIDNGDGTKQLVPIVNGVPQLGGPAQPATTGGLPPGYTVRNKGGAPSQGGGMFP